MPLKMEKVTRENALNYHEEGVKGKIELTTSKNLNSPYHLSLAYSPGVAYPCLEIEKNPSSAYRYTSKGHLVAVVSNGTAVLGLGNIGALASKPVMEGKSVLFKQFGGIDAIDIEVNETDIDKFVECVKKIAPSFGGINLEDIRAPECFSIEEKLKASVDIPVMHDDQHGTAICALAATINALEIVGKKVSEVVLVVNGAGAAGIACTKLLADYGLKKEHIFMCDSKGVIHSDRTDLNEWKKEFANKTNKRSLADALEGADIFLGLSQPDVITEPMLKSMNKDPIIFAMANPNPEIKPEFAQSIRNDVIIATGRSDYPNQINNLLAFPYIFRGALDVKAKEINKEMKIAAALAIANLTKEIIPDRVGDLYGSKIYGREYIIPTPFDPRLITVIPVAVAEAAIKSGASANKDFDLNAYRESLSLEVDPSTAAFRRLHQIVNSKMKKILFANGENDDVIRAASIFAAAAYGHPVLIGDKKVIEQKAAELNASLAKVEILDKLDYIQLGEELFKRVWRSGYSQKRCHRILKNNENTLGILLLELGKVDALIIGRGTPLASNFDQLKMLIAQKPYVAPMEIRVLHVNKKIMFIADTCVHEYPTEQELVKIAIQTAKKVREYGFEPRLAFISHNSFGRMDLAESKKTSEAVALLDKMNVDFEYEGEMSISYAIDHKKLKRDYPLARLTAPANIFIMPGIRTARIGVELLQNFAKAETIGSILIGFEKPVQFINQTESVQEIVNCACIASFEKILSEGRRE